MNGLNSFDPVAGYYDRLARLVFGQSMVSSQTEFLADISSSSNVLVLGGGTGWWLNELLRIRPDCRILFVEPSGRMLAMAKRRAMNDGRVRFLHGTEESLVQAGKFDVVLLFFVFDMFSDAGLEEYISKIRPLLKRDALWLVSDFVERKSWHSILLFTMYRFFGWVVKLKSRRLPGWEQVMEQRGFVVTKQKMFYGNFIKSAVYQMGKAQHGR